jgi:glycosyltransferase involved in cell wall biosynthesis
MPGDPHTTSVVIVHYHLRRGGVTRVIESASARLRAMGVPHVVLSGEPYTGGEPLPVRVIEDLGYRGRESAPDPAALAGAMRAAASDALGGSRAPLWHIHNHSLGKNAVFAESVALLARAGAPLLLQIHDFAEDGRPENYANISAPARLYPLGPRVHYAFLNSRDSEMMAASGLPVGRNHLLPNPIALPGSDRSGGGEMVHPHPDEAKPQSPIVLYPVRGIRRKNLGEILLLAALAPAGVRFAVTLGAENPHWQPVHDAWKHFAAESGLPVVLEAVGHHAPVPGAGATFRDWLACATHLVTTSVAEGFGLAFLEPVALGKPLFGRDLPEITRDFRAGGIRPGRLYRRILVPEGWIDPDRLRAELAHALRATLAAYGRDADTSTINATWRALHHPPRHFDFANLPESFQREIIRKAARAPNGADLLVQTDQGVQPAAEWLRETLARTRPSATPDQLTPYAPESYGVRLVSLFESIVANQCGGPLDFLPSGRILDRFHFPPLPPGTNHVIRCLLLALSLLPLSL